MKSEKTIKESTKTIDTPRVSRGSKIAVTYNPKFGVEPKPKLTFFPAKLNADDLDD